MQRRHLDEAKERGAGILDIGDLFCGMQGKYDKRSDKSCLREEHKDGDYLDSLVRTAADFFGPYAENFAVISPGNHETSIRSKHETDLTQRLVERMNTQRGTHIQAGGYGGWIKFQFAESADGKTNKKTWSQSVELKYFHGSGGGGPVTKGVIQTNRRAAFLPDADIIFTGHVHERWKLSTVQERLTESGSVEHREQVHICGATYKDEYGDGYGGWHVERGAPPKPLGAWWLRFYYSRPHEKILFDATDAK